MYTVQNVYMNIEYYKLLRTSFKVNGYTWRFFTFFFSHKGDKFYDFQYAMLHTKSPSKKECTLK